MVKLKPFLIFFSLIILDQLSKFLATKFNFDFGILAINLVTNTGATWGLLKDSNALLIWISIIAIGLLLWGQDKLPKKSKAILPFLFAGIVGNIIDRIVRGYVIDFIDFKFWPVFNIADILIVISVIGIVFLVVKEK